MERTGDRSTPQRSTRKARQAYPPETKARALEVLAASGVAAAHDETGVPKPTLSRWAHAAGIDLGAQATARTKVAAATVHAAAVEARIGTVRLLEEHIADAGEYLRLTAATNLGAARAILAAPADAHRVYTLVEGGSTLTSRDPATQAAVNYAQALGTLPLAVRDAEGMVTRAIHDLQLLNGEATERGELVVEFGVPRPRPETYTVVEQETLGIEP